MCVSLFISLTTGIFGLLLAKMTVLPRVITFHADNQ